MAALQLRRGKQLVTSSVAARLNGYVGGYGDKVGVCFLTNILITSAQESFLSERGALGVSEEVSDYVVEQIEERQ